MVEQPSASRGFRFVCDPARAAQRSGTRNSVLDLHIQVCAGSLRFARVLV